MKSILFLHGALGSKQQFAELEKKLSSEFTVYSLNFAGHGGEPVPDEPFSISMFANDALNFISSNNIDSVNIFGYSMGGYAAVWLAKRFPERVNKVFTLGTKFHWDAETAAREVKMLNPAKMKEKIPKFYDELCRRHAPQNIDTILIKTAEMMINLGNDNGLKPADYGSIDHEILVGLGDSDKMVTIEETADVCSRLPNGRLIVMPKTPHPLEGADMDLLADGIRKFLNE